MEAMVVSEPYRGHFFAEALTRHSGIDVLRGMLSGGVPDPPITRLSGLRLTEAGLGLATMSMPASPWWQSAAGGVFLAGVLAFVADGPLGAAVMTAAPPGTAMSSAGLSLAFVRPATTASGTLFGRGRLLHSTRLQGMAEVYVEDGQGRLLAHGTSRGMLVPLPPGAMNPPDPGDPATIDPAMPDPYLRDTVGDVLGPDYWDVHTGAQFAEAMLSGAVVPPFVRLTGLRWLEAGDGTATCTLPRSAWLCNGFGIMYGGALALLADFAHSSAMLPGLPAGATYAPLDLTLNYLRPVLPGDGVVTARAQVVHRGRTLLVTTCEITDEDGRAVALARGTTVLLPGRGWERSAGTSDQPWA